MSEYKHFKTKTKAKKQLQSAAAIGLSLLIVCLVGANGYVFTRLSAGLPLFDAAAVAQPSGPVSSDNSASQTGNSGVQEPSGVLVHEMGSRPWNVLDKLSTTLDQSLNSADVSMLGLPANGRVTRDYFATALFIGDSISQGLAMYGEKSLEGAAMVAAFKSTGAKQIIENATGSLPGNGGSVAMWDYICQQAPDKIYVMLGTNMLVNQSDDALLHYYGQLLDKLHEQFPAVPIYVQSILPVTAKAQAARPDKMSNDRIRNLNTALAVMALEKGHYYLNLHEVFENESGNLIDEIASASDGFHLKPDGYAKWVDYLSTHTAYSPMNLPYQTEAYI